jgi:hypothetical protein
MTVRYHISRRRCAHCQQPSDFIQTTRRWWWFPKITWLCIDHALEAQVKEIV